MAARRLRSGRIHRRRRQASDRRAKVEAGFIEFGMYNSDWLVIATEWQHEHIPIVVVEEYLPIL
jgi:hypothetical protein